MPPTRSMASAAAGSKMRCLRLRASRPPARLARAAVFRMNPTVTPLWPRAMDRTMSSLTQDLGSFVADLSFDRIPSAGCDIARTGIADCFGVLVAGARDPAIALIDREMGEGGGAPFASLIPSGARRSVEAAALVNGVAAHV